MNQYSRVNQVPRIQLPDSRDPIVTPNSSSVFVTTAKEFKRMTAAQVQEIFRDHHILVEDVEGKDFAFDKVTMHLLGYNISALLSVQGHNIHSIYC